MKKIALFSLMVCICGIYAVPALAGSCGTRILNLDGVQKPGDDEFLYTSTQAQTQAKKDYEKDGADKDNMKNGQYKLNPQSFVLECDKEQCDLWTTVYVPNEGVKENKKGKYFWCHTAAFDDQWNTFGECPEGQELQDRKFPFYVAENSRVVERNPGDYGVYSTYSVAAPCVCSENKEVVVEGGKKYCRSKGAVSKALPKQAPQDCPEGTMRATKDITVIGVCTGELCTPIVKGQCYDTDFLKCMEAADRGEPANWNGKSCNCGDRMVWDNKNYKCVPKGSNGGGKTTPKKTCKELYAGYPERIACCEAGKDTKWIGSVKDGTCSCVDKSKKWDSAKKQCITPEQSVVSESSDCIYDYDVTIVCNYGTFSKTYHEQGSVPVKKSKLDGLECDEFNARFATDVEKWKHLFGDKCKDGPMAQVMGPDDNTTTSVKISGNMGPSATEISNAQRILSAFTASAKDEASVWKTAEGNFNGARLASDITAGVVLGTVGGVVTGVIIKKNQVKKGFEALHCTVGGQKVADWGDEFSVGLQR